MLSGICGLSCGYGLGARRGRVSTLEGAAGDPHRGRVRPGVDRVDRRPGGRRDPVHERGRVMAGEGLAEAYNVAQFLGRLEDGGSKGAMRVGPRDAVVIDEASQVSTTDLAPIQAVVRAGGARVILTADTAQLGAG
jgi:hypothetical protein